MTVQRQPGTIEDALIQMAGHPAIGWGLMSDECDWSEDMLRKASNPNHEPRIQIPFRRAMQLDRLWMRVTGRTPLLLGVYLAFLDREDRYSALDPDMAILAVTKEHSEAVAAYMESKAASSPGGVSLTIGEKHKTRRELQELHDRTADAIAALDADIAMQPRHAG